jgi:hypothetical protein
MRTLIIIGALGLITAPAFAQEPNTLKEVTTKGIVLDVQGTKVDVTYKADGTFTAMEGQVTGKWRIDGDKLCAQSQYDPAEECVAYPKGKKSGDTFDVTGKQGTASVTIK